jgi:hypothetical protein
LWVIFALLDSDPDSESGSTDPIESGSNPDPDTDPDPQPWMEESDSEDYVDRSSIHAANSCRTEEGVSEKDQCFSRPLPSEDEDWSEEAMDSEEFRLLKLLKIVKAEKGIVNLPAAQISLRYPVSIVSVADPGCLSRILIFSIPDPNFFHPEYLYPNFFHPGSRIRIFSIPDPHQRI